MLKQEKKGVVDERKELFFPRGRTTINLPPNGFYEQGVGQASSSWNRSITPHTIQGAAGQGSEQVVVGFLAKQGTQLPIKYK